MDAVIVVADAVQRQRYSSHCHKNLLVLFNRDSIHLHICLYMPCAWRLAYFEYAYALVICVKFGAVVQMLSMAHILISVAQHAYTNRHVNKLSLSLFHTQTHANFQSRNKVQIKIYLKHFEFRQQLNYSTLYLWCWTHNKENFIPIIHLMHVMFWLFDLFSIILR